MISEFQCLDQAVGPRHKPYNTGGLTPDRKQRTGSAISKIGAAKSRLTAAQTERASAGGRQRDTGAGEGNRTLVCSLGSCRSTIELRPQSASV